MIDVKIKMLNGNTYYPKKGTKFSAAYDVYVPKDVTIHKGRQIVPLDFAMSMPNNIEALIDARSGYSSKGMEGKLADTIYRFDADVIQGKIDADFRGNCGVIIKSYEDRSFILTKGTRIAQMSFVKVENADFEEVDELEETERGEGGFGHTNDLKI